MKEHIDILKRFLTLLDEKDNAKLVSAINMSIKLLEKEDNRKKKLRKNYY